MKRTVLPVLCGLLITHACAQQWQGRAGAVSTSSSYTGAYTETGIFNKQNGLLLQYVSLSLCSCCQGDTMGGLMPATEPVYKIKQVNVLYQRALVQKKNVRITAETGLGLNQIFYREQRTPPVYKNGELVTPGVYQPAYTLYKPGIPLNAVTEFSPGRKNRKPGEKIAECWLGLRTGWQYVNGKGAVVIGLHLALTY